MLKRYRGFNLILYYYLLIHIITPRFIIDLLLAIFIYVTPYFKSPSSDDYPFYYYLIFTIARAAHYSNDTAIGRSIDAFFAQIIDVRIAATYMSLLSTMMSLCP